MRVALLLLLAACRVVPPVPDQPPSVVATCPNTRPPLRTCAADRDCAVVSHSVDCCGSAVVTGINLADLRRYEEQERLCPTVRAGCECEAQQTVADDGSPERSRPASVRCVKGTCTSSFLPP